MRTWYIGQYRGTGKRRRNTSLMRGRLLVFKDPAPGQEGGLLFGQDAEFLAGDARFRRGGERRVRLRLGTGIRHPRPKGRTGEWPLAPDRWWWGLDGTRRRTTATTTTRRRSAASRGRIERRRRLRRERRRRNFDADSCVSTCQFQTHPTQGDPGASIMDGQHTPGGNYNEKKGGGGGEGQDH